MSGVAVGLGIGALAGPGATIGRSSITIGLGVGAFAGPCPAIDMGGLAIGFRLCAFSDARLAIIRCLPPVGGGFSPNQC